MTALKKPDNTDQKIVEEESLLGFRLGMGSAG